MFAPFCPIHHYNGLLHWRSPQQQPWLRSQKSQERSINTQMSNCWTHYTVKHQARHCISLRNRSLHPLAMFLPTKHPSIPWVPEAFHARFPASVKSCLRPAADETKLPVAREKKPLVRGQPFYDFLQILKKNSERISMDSAGHRALKLVNFTNACEVRDTNLTICKILWLWRAIHVSLLAFNKSFLNLATLLILGRSFQWYWRIYANWSQ